MTAKELQTIAKLEERTEYMKGELQEVKKEIQSVNKKIDAVLEEIRTDRTAHNDFVSKRAMQWFIGIAISITAIVVSVVNGMRTH